MADIKGRNPKSIREKLLMCAEYEGRDKNLTIGQIQRVMSEKFVD